MGLYGKNLLDKEYKTSGYNFLTARPDTGELVLSIDPASPNFNVPGIAAALGPDGTLTAFYGNPRQVFASVTFTY